jgi:hypothetical protein
VRRHKRHKDRHCQPRHFTGNRNVAWLTIGCWQRGNKGRDGQMNWGGKWKGKKDLSRMPDNGRSEPSGDGSSLLALRN